MHYLLDLTENPMDDSSSAAYVKADPYLFRRTVKALDITLVFFGHMFILVQHSKVHFRYEKPTILVVNLRQPITA